MQNVKLKKIAFFSLIFTALSHLVYSQDVRYQSAQADSLFMKQDFTQSLRIYEQVFLQTKQASPSMLLKMAYIEEGVGNYTKALYYLSIYYIQRPNLQVINKMKEMAATYNLKGYEFKDVDFFMILYQRYYVYFTLLLLSICFIWLASLVARKIRREYLPIRHIIGCILFMITVLLFLNIKKSEQKAIVAQDNVYVMSAPSAGAKLITIIEKGHRLDIVDKNDIWIEVLWNDQPAYIRQQNVLLIQ